jgi:hypothetical protein
MNSDPYGQDIARRPENRCRRAELDGAAGAEPWRSEGFFEDLDGLLPLAGLAPAPTPRRVASTPCWRSTTFVLPGPAAPTAWPSTGWR